MDPSEKKMILHNRVQLNYFSRSEKKTMVPGSSPYVLKQIEQMMQFGAFSKDDSLLDVGCGMGRYTLPITDMGYRVSGLDLTPFLLKKFRQYESGSRKVPLYCCDVIDAPKKISERFDGVIGFFTLHHIHHLKRSFEAMARLLKPGGRIVFLEPNAFNPLYYVQMMVSPNITWRGDKGTIHMRWSLINRLMQSVGLSDTDIRRFGFFPPFLSNRRYVSMAEKYLEKFPPWRFLLPFQLFKGMMK